MNIGSYLHDESHRYEPNRLYLLVPIPEDYTPEERAYAQEELVRLTELSMYKIIDEIGQRREDVTQRLREAQQKEARRQVRVHQEGQDWRTAIFGDRAPGHGAAPWKSGAGPGYGGEASTGPEGQASEAPEAGRA